MYKFRRLSFPLDDARPIILPHEYVHSIEITLLEHIHKNKTNHNPYNLNQNTNHESLTLTEEVEIIRALELLWPLRRTKNVSPMFANFFITSDTIKTNFLRGFFPETEPS